MPDQVIQCLPRPLVHYSHIDSDSSADAPSGGRSGPTAPPCNCTLDRGLGSTARDAHRPSPLRHSHSVCKLAKHLLVLPRSSVSDPDSPLPLHARLPQHKPRWFELLQYAVQHRQNGLQAPGSGPSMFRGIPGVLHIHRFLDDVNIPSLVSAILVRFCHHWPLLSHRHWSYGLWAFLLKGHHRSLRASVQRYPWADLLPHRGGYRHVRREVQHRRASYPSLRHRPRDSDVPDRQPFCDLRNRAKGEKPGQHCVHGVRLLWPVDGNCGWEQTIRGRRLDPQRQCECRIHWCCFGDLFREGPVGKGMGWMERRLGSEKEGSATSGWK